MNTQNWLKVFSAKKIEYQEFNAANILKTQGWTSVYSKLTESLVWKVFPWEEIKYSEIYVAN